jgi:thiol-disulfide isomerase/thioredoxin
MKEGLSTCPAAGRTGCTDCRPSPANDLSRFWLANTMRTLTGSLLALAVLAGSISAEDTAATGVAWQPDLKSAHLAAKESGKPILIVFGAEWCTYCHKLEREVINQPETAAYINENFVPLHLDFDKEERVAELLDVKSLPCTVVITANAELLGKYVGYADTPKYTAHLETAHEAFETLQTAAAESETTVR